MTCKETQTYMDGYLDRELDLVRSIDLERHLHDCSPCSDLHRSRLAVRSAMSPSALRYSAPAGLKKQILASLPDEKRAVSRWAWVSFATAVAAAVVVVLFLRPDSNLIERQVVDSHIRSMMAAHLTDVVSTDQHTVKPWFAGKLDFSPLVQDHADQGFPLIGGRLDYFADHPVAVVVYQRNRHVINVFTWPTPERAQSLRTAQDRGFNTIQFTRDGSEFWIVSDLNLQELQQFCRLL